MEARGRVDARDPQPPELDVLGAPVAIGILRRPLGGLFRSLPQFAAPAPVALGELHHFVLALQARDVAFDARHAISLRQQQALEATVGMRNERRLAQMTLPLRMLRGQDVALVRFVPAQLAGARESDALPECPFGFLLRHWIL